MNAERRVFLAVFVPGAAWAGASFIRDASAFARAPQSTPRGQQQQNPPPPQNSPLLPKLPPPPTEAQLRQNQRDIRKDVDQLFSLAQELKNLAEKSDAAQELSVALITKTEQIEKLAKKIRDLARD
jgi:hypothetical protein